MPSLMNPNSPLTRHNLQNVRRLVLAIHELHDDVRMGKLIQLN